MMKTEASRSLKAQPPKPYNIISASSCWSKQFMGFPGGTEVKYTRTNAGGIRDMGLLGREDPLEKEMATHSSILAQKNPMGRGA